jgi:hypothetical protein
LYPIDKHGTRFLLYQVCAKTPDRPRAGNFARNPPRRKSPALNSSSLCRAFRSNRSALAGMPGGGPPVR